MKRQRRVRKIRHRSAPPRPKPIEMPIGDNAGILQMKVDRYHVGTPAGEVIREIWRSIPRSKRNIIPRPLRRGVIKFIADRHHENLKLYARLMSGNF